MRLGMSLSALLVLAGCCKPPPPVVAAAPVKKFRVVLQAQGPDGQPLAVEVRDGSELLGSTPLELLLDGGEHNYSLAHPDFPSQEVRVTAGEGGTATVRMTRHCPDWGVPRLVSTTPMPQRGFMYRNLAVDSGRLYVAGQRHSEHGVLVLDAEATPPSLRVLGWIEIQTPYLVRADRGHVLVYSHREEGFVLFDARNPAHARRLSYFPASYTSPPPASALVGGRVYHTSWQKGLHIYDISEPAEPFLWGAYGDPVEIGGRMGVSGTTVFLSGADFLAIDTREPRWPREIGRLKLGRGARYPHRNRVSVWGELAADWDYVSLDVIDISDPSHMQPVGRIELAGRSKEEFHDALFVGPRMLVTASQESGSGSSDLYAYRVTTSGVQRVQDEPFGHGSLLATHGRYLFAFDSMKILTYEICQ